MLLCSLTQTITDALIKIFRFPELVTVLISVLPIVEARGAIPVAFSYGIHPLLALLYAFIGSSLMAPVLIAVLLPFVRWLSKTKLFRKVGQTLYEKFEKKSQNILKEQDDAGAGTNAAEESATDAPANKKRLSAAARIMLGVFAFVAVPLPLTGVWTGSAVAALTKLSYPKALLSVVAGNLVASSIITLLCFLLPAKAIDYVILAIGAIAIAVVIVLIVKIIVHKSPEDKEKTNGEVAPKEND
ncbi:MAG: small multi-drug export protein [Clostridiales bacterium]|nr:small multi-drug export protein [Clostridiales bacterium]